MQARAEECRNSSYRIGKWRWLSVWLSSRIEYMGALESASLSSIFMFKVARRPLVVANADLTIASLRTAQPKLPNSAHNEPKTKVQVDGEWDPACAGASRETPGSTRVTHRKPHGRDPNPPAKSFLASLRELWGALTSKCIHR